MLMSKVRVREYNVSAKGVGMQSVPGSKMIWEAKCSSARIV